MTARRWPLARAVVRHAGRRWPAALVIAAVTLLRVAVDVLKPWPMKVLVDHALHRDPLPGWLAGALSALPGDALAPRQLAAWCVAATVAVFVAGWALAAASAVANVAFGQRLAYDVAADLFAHLQRLSPAFHARSNAGDAIRRVTADSAAVATLVQGAILPAVTSIATLAAILSVAWRLDPALTLVALAVVPPIALAFRRYGRPMVELSYRHEQAGGRLYTVVEQTLSAMPVVQTFAREAEETSRYRRTTAESYAATLALTGVQLRFKVLVGTATALGTAAVLYMGGRQVLAGELTLGVLLVFLSYLASLYAPIEALAYTSTTARGAAGSARRVTELLATAPEVVEAPHAVRIARPEGEVRLERVTFGYEPGRPVLRDVTLTAAPGRVVALVGPTGAGKTTLASLVPRLFDPWEGRVLLDGRDVRDLRLEDLRRNVALVPQDAFLFPVTVADNIAYGRPGATRQAIEDAARAANAEEFILRLPRGYDTVVGERGATLSGGQRQRLAIARALLVDAPVLVLDEPTSALDAGTEHLLWEAVGRLMRRRTAIVIAHRLATVRAADEIVVLDGGRVAERGIHPELLAAGGLYSRLCAAQFGGTPGVG